MRPVTHSLIRLWAIPPAKLIFFSSITQSTALASSPLKSFLLVNARSAFTTPVVINMLSDSCRIDLPLFSRAEEKQIWQRLERLAKQTGDPGEQVVGARADIGPLGPGQLAQSRGQVLADVMQNLVPVRTDKEPDRRPLLPAGSGIWRPRSSSSDCRDIRAGRGDLPTSRPSRWPRLR